MLVAQQLINKPIITVEEGKELGKVQDFFVDRNLTRLVAIYLGSEGLFGRHEKLIKWSDVITLGEDAILVRDADCVVDMAEAQGLETYMRRSEISGRRIDTPGGTRIGSIGDIVIDEEARITGFSLPMIYVSGPIAANQAISRSAIIDTDGDSGTYTANLTEAEKADFQVVYEGFFAEPAVSPAEPDKELSAES